MPGKLISNLRFLNPPPAALQSVRVGTTGILSRIFPFKLKYVGVGLGPPGVRSFRASASKSLIEDEAELSSWVSGMRSGSLRGSGDEDGDEGFGSGRGSGRDRGRGRGRGMVRGRGRGGGREGFSGKRSREEEDYGGDLEEDRFGSQRKRGGRGGEFRSWGRGGGRGREVDFGGRKSSGRGEREYSSGNGRGREVDFGGRRGGRALGGRGRGRGGDRGSYDDKGEFSGMRGGRGRGGRFDSGRGGRGRMQFGDGNRRDFGERRGGKVESVRKSFYEEEEEDEEEEEEDRVRVAMIGSDLGDFSHNESESDDDEGEDYDDDGGVGNTARTSLGLKEDAGGRITTVSTGPSDSYLTETRFDQCAISPLSMKAVRDAGYEKMTVVQEATLPIILKGKDVLAKAKTGTGKTVAFLLPSIEVVAKTQPVGGDEKRPPILVLVICPTRELASQAASETNKLLKYHRSIGVQVVIGGTRLPQEQKRMQTNPCQILVATPGRLQDHIENTAGFATRLMGVKILVLDEADHLLDMGFRRAIEKIIAAVPKQRQTLLFSATVPDEVRQICHLALKKDHEYINTVEEGTEETHAKVRQMHLVAPLEKQFPILYTLLKDHIADNSDFKVLVFCTTAMVTKLVADLLGKLHLNVREIHSRKPQSYRTRVSDEFRKSNGLILVTSDVSARGVDYPDVTLVVQLGVPADRQQYIHRLGRTGRKGKEGEGILLLAPWEEFFVSTIRDLPITKGTLPSVDPGTAKKVEHALSNVDMKNKESAYQAWLGYYNSNRAIGRDKAKLVELANSFSRSMGLDIPPAISKMVLGKMGLKNVPGLRSK